MLPQLAANAGYSGSDYFKATTSATVSADDQSGTIGTDYSTSANRDLLNQDYNFQEAPFPGVANLSSEQTLS